MSQRTDEAGSRLEILVVEDSPAYAAWVTNLLRQEAMQHGRVVTATRVPTLTDAFAHLADHATDAVLLDMNLPDSEGVATVATLTERFPQVAVVVISAVDDEATALRTLRKGAEEYLVKGHENPGSVFRAITRSIERKVVELRLAAAETSARQNERMAAVGMVASGVAHEYSNVGAVILGNVEQLLSDSELPPEVRVGLQNIRNAAQRANVVTQGLLKFVRGHGQPMTNVGMHDVVLETVNMARTTLRNFEVSVTIDAPSPQPYVTGNSSILGQVLLNLVVNACHAMMGQPKRELHIELSKNEALQVVSVKVADTGIGVPPEDLPRLFLPFFSTKGDQDEHEPNANLRGTGLGLTISESLVKQHGGTLDVQSEWGHGATFTLALPAAQAHDEGKPSRSLSKPPPQPSQVVGRRVLVVNDDPTVRRVVSQALQTDGVVTEGVATMADALARIQKDHVDLVLVDWQLPEGHGDALIRAIGARDVDHRPAILVASGHLPDDEKAELDALGVPVLPKPFGFLALRQAVAEALT